MDEANTPSTTSTAIGKREFTQKLQLAVAEKKKKREAEYYVYVREAISRMKRRNRK